MRYDLRKLFKPIPDEKVNLFWDKFLRIPSWKLKSKKLREKEFERILDETVKDEYLVDLIKSDEK
jgi:hypothetical protein